MTGSPCYAPINLATGRGSGPLLHMPWTIYHLGLFDEQIQALTRGSSFGPVPLAPDVLSANSRIPRFCLPTCPPTYVGLAVSGQLLRRFDSESASPLLCGPCSSSFAHQYGPHPWFRLAAVPTMPCQYWCPPGPLCWIPFQKRLCHLLVCCCDIAKSSIFTLPLLIKCSLSPLEPRHAQHINRLYNVWIPTGLSRDNSQSWWRTYKNNRP